MPSSGSYLFYFLVYGTFACFHLSFLGLHGPIGLTGPLADTLRRISEQAGKMNADGKMDPALLQELADLKMALNAVNAEMRRPSISHLLQQQPPDEEDPISDDMEVFGSGSSRALDELCSDESDVWPMEWDECWEERWAAIEELMINNKAFKDRVIRILSQSSVKHHQQQQEHLGNEP